MTDTTDRTRKANSSESGEIRVKLSDAEAEAMLLQLREHFGENVMPASRYCDAFTDWRDALIASGAMPEVVEAFASLCIPIYKSNYLARRIYGGDPHRTEPCPVHKGRWSGCEWHDNPEDICECEAWGNTTGWLPAEGGQSDRAEALARRAAALTSPGGAST